MIKYCPFCGYPAYIEETKFCETSTYKVKCGNCGASLPKSHSSELKAIKAWNIRNPFCSIEELYDMIYEWCGYDPGAVKNTLDVLKNIWNEEENDATE